MGSKTHIAEIVSAVLGAEQTLLTVESYTLTENMLDGGVCVACEVRQEPGHVLYAIEGHGVGLVDAFFHGLVRMYVKEYPSLATLRFSDFSIQAKLDTGTRATLTDSHAEVTLWIVNSHKRGFSFTDISPSITRSALKVVSEALSFFINSEKAFVSLYRAYQHAQNTGRVDSAHAYQVQLATLVEATSYEDVIAHLHTT